MDLFFYEISSPYCILVLFLSIATILKYHHSVKLILFPQMTSVERISDYSKILPEAPMEIPERKSPPDWPRFGALTFDQVSFAYFKGGPNVLQKVSFTVKAKEKVCFVLMYFICLLVCSLFVLIYFHWY